MACAMAEMAIEDGITHVIGTPHASPGHPFIPELIKARRDELQSHFEGRLILATGCDFHLSFENLQDIRRDATRFTLNQKNYVLVEFADYSIPPSLDQALHELHLAGLRPIITHPERNPLIRTQPDRLFQWLRQGCYVQVTAQSLLGKFGEAAQETALQWLDEGAIHFIASDAHNITSRPLRLKETFDFVAKERGENVARALMVENPRAAFDGLPLPYIPELPENAGTDASHASGPRLRKRFWFF
jgi:protein-tyrosine phosphatase